MLEKFKSEEFLNEYRTSEKYRAVREKYEEYFERSNITPSPLLFSQLRLFDEIGDRNAYAKPFDEHYNKLKAMAYKAIFFKSPEIIRELEDCIYDMLSIYCWAIPAHVPDINEENYYELDLCSVSVATTLAVIHHLLKDDLHPLIEKRIVTELKRRILEPFKAQHWHWEDRYNNWTAVCAGFTGVAIMLVFPEEFMPLLPRFDENMRKYLAGFPDDGVCLEGPGYWGYGLSSFLAYALLLKEFTNGERDYFKDKKVKDVSLFFQKTRLSQNEVTNYGDCPRGVKTNASLFHLLKKEYGNEFNMPPESTHALPTDPILHMLYYIENYQPMEIDEELSFGEWYMPIAGWYLKRCKKYSFSAKGGTNGESHNHNDVGSFILAIGDEQILCDVGGRPYTKDYFQEKRYEYFEPSSRSHNVPIINEKYQICVGRRASTSFEDGAFKVEFSSLYDQAELTHLERSFRCDEDSIIVRDEYQLCGTFKERLVSSYEPKIEEGAIYLKGLKISFDKNVATAKYHTEMHATDIDTSGNMTRGQEIYCIDIDVSHPSQFTFKIKIL